MRKKKEIKSEKKKEADKKGAERMRRFQENQENAKLPRKKKEAVAIEDGGMTCQTYWEKNVTAGDDEWVERQYYYKKKKKGEKFEI